MIAGCRYPRFGRAARPKRGATARGPRRRGRCGWSSGKSRRASTRIASQCIIACLRGHHDATWQVLELAEACRGCGSSVPRTADVSGGRAGTPPPYDRRCNRSSSARGDTRTIRAGKRCNRVGRSGQRDDARVERRHVLPEADLRVALGSIETKTTLMPVAVARRHRSLLSSIGVVGQTSGHDVKPKKSAVGTPAMSRSVKRLPCWVNSSNETRFLRGRRRRRRHEEARHDRPRGRAGLSSFGSPLSPYS